MNSDGTGLSKLSCQLFKKDRRALVRHQDSAQHRPDERRPFRPFRNDSQHHGSEGRSRHQCNSIRKSDCRHADSASHQCHAREYWQNDSPRQRACQLSMNLKKDLRQSIRRQQYWHRCKYHPEADPFDSNGVVKRRRIDHPSGKQRQKLATQQQNRKKSADARQSVLFCKPENVAVHFHRSHRKHAPQEQCCPRSQPQRNCRQ